MIDKIIGAIVKAFENGTISPVVLILCGVCYALFHALYRVYSAKEAQTVSFANIMDEATKALTISNGQLNVLTSRMQEIQAILRTAGENAASNREILVKMQAILEYGYGKR